MNKTTKLALLALAAFGLSAQAATATNDWWNVTFEDDSFQENFPGLTVGELGSITNNESTMAGVVQPYAEGVWTALDGDESYITNEYCTVATNGYSFGSDYCLKLDTQGNDLTWTAEDTTNGVINVVDADLFLVGSDSAPDVSDFDASKDVQTAVYLKNEVDEGTGDTTNSVLCVYVSKFFGGNSSNIWQELDGVELDDNAWAHVQVVVNHNDSLDSPQVSVTVNGTQMHARGNASETEWAIANPAGPTGNDPPTAVSSVAFRGTGAVDNFVGTTLVEETLILNLTAQSFVDDTLQATDAIFSPTVIRPDQVVSSTSSAEFSGFNIDNYLTSPSGEATIALSKIEILDPADGTTVVATFNYTYTPTEVAAASGQVVADADDSAYVAFDPDFFDDNLQGGPFTLTVPSAGAVTDAVIAKVYFTTIGAYNALAVTDLAGTVSTNKVLVKPADVPLTTNWTFSAVNGGGILSTIQVYGDATFAYSASTSNATVSVTLNAALAADTLFAEAVYTNGTLAANQTLQPDAGVSGLYTFSVVETVVPPVDQHTGAKSDNGFIILDSTDPDAAGKQLEFTDIDPSAGTAAIEAVILNPNGDTSVTLQLIYRTSLTGQDQYVDATISNIDTTSGTATVTFTPPANEDAVFLIGFRNKAGIVDAEP